MRRTILTLASFATLIAASLSAAPARPPATDTACKAAAGAIPATASSPATSNARRAPPAHRPIAASIRGTRIRSPTLTDEAAACAHDARAATATAKQA